MNEVTIYILVAAALGVGLFLLAIIFIIRKCRNRRDRGVDMADVVFKDQEAVSINSASSKDLLLYGTRQQAEPASNAKTASHSSTKIEPMSETMTTQAASSLRKTDASRSDDRLPHDTLIDIPPGDKTTTFLQQRRQSSNSAEIKVGSLQPNLYKRRGSVLTTRASAGFVGKVRLKLYFDFGKSDFIVTISETTDIDPTINEFLYKVFLKPGVDAKRRESLSHKKSSKTTFREQQFKFPLTYEQLMEQRLVVQMYDSGRIGKLPQLVGEVGWELEDLDPSEETEVWADVAQKSQKDTYGELLCSLSYLSSVQRLTVTVHEARDLMKMDITGSSDPYVKVVLHQSGKVVKKRNTAVKKSTLKPVWNEAINFTTPEKALSTTSVELIVKDHDLVGHNETLGRVVLNNETEETRARNLWDDMLHGKSSPPTWLSLSFYRDEKQKSSDSHCE